VDQENEAELRQQLENMEKEQVYLRKEKKVLAKQLVAANSEKKELEKEKDDLEGEVAYLSKQLENERKQVQVLRRRHEDGNSVWCRLLVVFCGILCVALLFVLGWSFMEQKMRVNAESDLRVEQRLRLIAESDLRVERERQMYLHRALENVDEFCRRAKAKCGVWCNFKALVSAVVDYIEPVLQPALPPSY